MSEEHVEDVVEGMLRQSLAAGSQLAEQVVRARQQYLRAVEQRGEQAAVEAQRVMAADRAVMQSVIIPATRDDWWDTARPEQITQAHMLAEAWKDHDPAALAASTKITGELKNRYGIDTDDLHGDATFLQDHLTVLAAAEQRMAAAKEHAEAMALVAAAQAEHIKRYSAELKNELDRHHVPPEYLASEEMVSALQASKEASGTDAAPDADRAVAERVHLIEQDGINGPSIDDLRQEIGQNYPDAEDSMFADAAFVATARDWHEAKALAEGGFVDQGNTGLEARYENAEKEIFMRLAPLGREIQGKVLNDPNLKTPDPAAKVGEPSIPAYGSTEHYEGFESSLEGKATEAEIKGRVAAARGQAAHPVKAVKAPKKTPKVRKATASAGMGRDKSPDGPSR
uniref:hypothetical protein n=1 Tax=Arthrobacter sp. TaxID=1667 RepID=UPI000EB7359E|nr:hypothetical protein [Arthrobacter sp.]AXV46591.1 hypothetical protein pA58H2_p45 [Arthrobacter sp.]